MSWLDALLGKNIWRNDTALPDRKILRFIQGAGATVTVADNTSTDDGLGSTDVTIDAGSLPVSPVIDVDMTADDNGTRYFIGDVEGITINLPPSADISVGYTASIRTQGIGTAKFQADGTDQISEQDGALSTLGQLQTTKAGHVTVEWNGATWQVTAEGGIGWTLT